MNNSESFLIEKKILDLAPLEELAEVLNKNLKDNFDYVNVEVIDCPDLTEKPFFLANSGLNGSTKLIEVGGPKYAQNSDKIYDLKSIAKLVDSNPAFIIGAAAGPPIQLRTELMVNLNIVKDVVTQQSRFFCVDKKNEEEIMVEMLPATETRMQISGNFFLCEGKPGKVLKIHTKKRIGSDDFITNIRQILVKAYPEKVLGLGGAFLLKEGKAKHHIIRSSQKKDVNLSNWLKSFNLSAPLINVGTLINNDYNLDLEKQHFHSFSHHGEAGHFYIDTTPDSAEYLGYFNIASEIYRIDRPQE